jgi:hypothetical protein
MSMRARRRLAGSFGALCMILFVSSVSARDCERGVLDEGEAGMNVLVYELCAERLSVGFRSSDVIEEISCRPSGGLRLWMSVHHERCDTLPAASGEQTYELLEPLRGVGRSTVAPVLQHLRCGAGTPHQATIVIADARDALLETRTGDTKYERLTRQLISRCDGPGV